MELNAARIPEAIGILEESIRLRPARATGHLNLSTALLAAGRRQEAITQIEPLRLEPGSATAHNNLGAALISMPDAAMRELSSSARRFASISLFTGAP
jgi:predicted Zn-dependent protease